MTSGQTLAERAGEVMGCLADLRRTEEFLGQLHADVRWFIPGAWPHISGVKDFDQIAVFMRKVFPAGFPDGIEVVSPRVHQSGATVVVEFTGVARTSKSRSYENSYCFVLEFEGDRVIEIREYMDTLYADRVLHQEATVPTGEQGSAT